MIKKLSRAISCSSNHNLLKKFSISGKHGASAHPYIYMNIFKKFLLRAKEFLFPCACVLCGGSLIEPDETRCGLCAVCSSSITLEQGSRCKLCGKPLISEIDTCLPCRSSEGRSYERLWALFPYIGKYRKLISAYKFYKNFALACFFSDKISEILTNVIFAEIPELKNAVIVPVPPRPGKIKDTGWDQVEYLVKRLEQLPVCRCLRRRKSKAQKSLSREERLDNLKGRIYMNDASAIQCLDAASQPAFILIDDVITTGSTIEACSAVLKEAGAGKVYGLCLFFD